MTTNVQSTKTSRILLVLGLAACSLAVTTPSEAMAADPVEDIQAKITELRARVDGLLAPAEWVMKTGSGEVTSKTVYKLCNTQSGECLGWKEQPSGTGINMSWFEESADKQARLVKQGGGTIQYGDTVALFVGKTDDSYLCYDSRPFGINLTWSTKPCYQWRIDAPAAGRTKGAALRVGDPFVLFNLTTSDKVVRCARSKSAFKGAWLKWGETCSKVELAYTNKSLYEKLMKELRALAKQL
jgi:hypothetical protein